LHERLTALGIAEAELFAKRIARWRSGQLRALQSEAAQAAFERVLPELIAAIAASPNPVEALNRLDSLFERLPSVLNIFHLLEARPQLRERLARILAHAPTLAQELARKVALLDGLIDASALDLPPPVAPLAARFGVGEADDDYQRTLDRVRDHVGEQRFALGVQLIEGAHDPLAIAQGYARVAEAAIAALVPATIAEFARTHGVVPDSELVLLAFGRLGGSELTHASDLDLVFLFTGDASRESDGRRPLGATRYYNSLAQRLISALSAPTAAGKLYEVDTRLRPWGAKGLLAVSVDSFLKYQREEAWTWEHMALTRARVVYGSAPVAAALTKQINMVLAAPREPEALRKAVRKMRLEMVTHKPPLGPLDAKLIEGGLVDWEFIVHFLQLHSGQGLSPHLPDAVRALVAAGLLALEMVDAHALLTRLLIALRLIAPDGHYPPEASRTLIARAAGTDQWDRLLAQFAAARQMVIAEWNRLLRPDPNETFGDLS
jgi:glutamate-ammonia-ligase adenylyltransferase